MSRSRICGLRYWASDFANEKSTLRLGGGVIVCGRCEPLRSIFRCSIFLRSLIPSRPMFSFASTVPLRPLIISLLLRPFF
ncbi:hypothetical protein [Neorhodopirellula lusitana]|uniref:hypothetical protein n=1 Tax=Neorhodopirellula lusitana TaxID=445327 RepID=UPI00384C507D